MSVKSSLGSADNSKSNPTAAAGRKYRERGRYTTPLWPESKNRPLARNSINI
jgi:hypothetical protein